MRFLNKFFPYEKQTSSKNIVSTKIEFNPLVLISPMHIHSSITHFHAFSQYSKVLSTTYPLTLEVSRILPLRSLHNIGGALRKLLYAPAEYSWQPPLDLQLAQNRCFHRSTAYHYISPCHCSTMCNFLEYLRKAPHGYSNYSYLVSPHEEQSFSN